MEAEKSFTDYWELVKTWVKDHWDWVTWPFEQLSKLFSYVFYILEKGSTQERLVLGMVVLALLMMAYVAFIMGLKEIMIRLPGFNRMPIGMPKNEDYMVQPTGYDRPVDYEWRYPLLWVGGTEFSFHKALLNKDDPLHFYLNTGTEVHFIPRPHKMRGK